MTREETKAMLKVLRAGYPNFYKGLTQTDANDIISLWSTMFTNDPAAVVVEAVKALMCTLQFPPTIADVKGKIRMIQEPDKMTEMEAWSLVQRAIKDSNYNSEAHFNALPPIIQKVIGSHNVLREYAMMDTATVNSVIQSNFMRSYKDKKGQMEAYMALPDSTKEMIQGLSKRYELTEGV